LIVPPEHNFIQQPFNNQNSCNCWTSEYFLCGSVQFPHNTFALLSECHNWL